MLVRFISFPELLDGRAPRALPTACHNHFAHRVSRLFMESAIMLSESFHSVRPVDLVHHLLLSGPVLVPLFRAFA